MSEITSLLNSVDRDYAEQLVKFIVDTCNISPNRLSVNEHAGVCEVRLDRTGMTVYQTREIDAMVTGFIGGHYAGRHHPDAGKETWVSVGYLNTTERTAAVVAKMLNAEYPNVEFEARDAGGNGMWKIYVRSRYGKPVCAHTHSMFQKTMNSYHMLVGRVLSIVDEGD